MRRILFAIIALSLTTVTLPVVLGSHGVSPVGPVTNPDFEHPATPPTLVEPLQGTPLDGCIGIGHQALFGHDSTQGRVLGLEDGEDYNTVIPPDPTETTEPADYQAYAEERTTDASEGAPSEAENAAGDPQGYATEETNDQVYDQTDQDNCMFSDEEGYDLVWLAPVERLDQPAHWSKDPDDPGVEFGYNFDTDPFDREAHFEPGVGHPHNMWQAYPSPFQAFSANGDAFELDVEAGEIPDTARVQFFLNAVPLDTQQDPEDGALGIDCSLTFNNETMTENMDEETGHVAVDPVDAVFSDRNDEDCTDLKAAWDEAEDDERRDILGRLRIVQISFRNWNTGDEGVTVDNVQLVGATTLAEELARGNVNPHPPEPS